MDLDKFELKDLKAMIYDESKILAIAQNNIRIIEEEISKRAKAQREDHEGSSTSV